MPEGRPISTMSDQLLSWLSYGNQLLAVGDSASTHLVNIVKNVVILGVLLAPLGFTLRRMRHGDARAFQARGASERPEKGKQDC